MTTQEKEGNCSILRLCDRRWWNPSGSLIRATKFLIRSCSWSRSGCADDRPILQALFGKAKRLSPRRISGSGSRALANFAEAMAGAERRRRNRCAVPGVK